MTYSGIFVLSYLFRFTGQKRCTSL